MAQHTFKLRLALKARRNINHEVRLADKSKAQTIGEYNRAQQWMHVASNIDHTQANPIIELADTSLQQAL